MVEIKFGGTFTRMFKDLSPGIKISISRSISTAFEQYMNQIRWNENKFDIEKFISEWQHYITNNSSWYEKISDDVKNNPAFHEQLADKINETIDKILSEEPTEEQMQEIDRLQQEVGEERNYSCKTEAKFVIEDLKQELKKK
ncbi:hypothetical protein [Bacillus dakarensis]|uniref:hypothetical protein n=1 Tax=Robertmurraya dakarensis TaxID=1926278 RepID=UPI001F3CD4E9|nr:hypothetical protein [Bacillus dakarensis]